jgi:hypothetical protein
MSWLRVDQDDAALFPQFIPVACQSLRNRGDEEAMNEVVVGTDTKSCPF